MDEAFLFQGVQHIAALQGGVGELQNTLGPKRLGPKVDDGLKHVERRWISWSVGTACLADHRFDLRKAAQQAIAMLEVIRRLRDADARHRGRHVQRSSLIQWRHEGNANLGKVVGPQAKGEQTNQCERGYEKAAREKRG